MINVSDKYIAAAKSQVRPLDWNARIAWQRERDDTKSWFILNQSKLDGNSMLVPAEGGEVMPLDAYNYIDESPRLINATVSRSVEFPYNVQSSIADFSLNNYDGRYTFDDPSSDIAEYVLPSRPVQLGLGFKNADVIQTFAGFTTAMPIYDGLNEATASFVALDLLGELAKEDLRNMVRMVNARTDEVIREILIQYGLDESQFELEHGINVIPFVVLNAGTKVGMFLQRLVQAENGKMWVDERGKIHFVNRTSGGFNKPVATYNEDSIIEIQGTQSESVINKVDITSEVRELQPRQSVFSNANDDGYSKAAKEDNYRISGGGKLEIWLDFDDPVWQVSTPTLNGGENTSRFIAKQTTGDVITGGITCDITLFNDSAKLVFENSNRFSASISYIEIWGEPAKVVENIRYEAYDEASVEKFGIKQLSITENNLFGSRENARDYAMNVLENNADFSQTIEMKIIGNPHIQLFDVVSVDYSRYTGDWQVVGKEDELNITDGMTTTLTMRRYHVIEPFILNVDKLNSDKRLA